MEAVQVIAAVLQVLIVILPSFHGVIRHPGGIQNGFPQLFHSGAGPHAGEYLLGPGSAGNGSNAPLLLIFQLILVGLQNGIAHPAGLGDLFHIDALETVRVLGNQMDPGRHHVYIVLLPCLLPILHGAHGGNAAVAHMELRQRLIVPLYGNLPGLGLVGLLHHHCHKLRLVQVCVNEHLLSLLDIHALFHNQAGIFP